MKNKDQNVGNLENSIPVEPEKSSDENIFIADSENSLTIQEQEIMEVHKHPHHVTVKQKWPEYLLEFFMIFLAVTLGFIAENIRENTVEKRIEKQLMISLVRDLELDTLDLSAGIEYVVKGNAQLFESSKQDAHDPIRLIKKEYHLD